MQELKPCPSCGSNLVIAADVDDHGVTYGHVGLCKNCGASGPPRLTEKDAAEDWNALPRRLTWTKARPKKPGFYFVRGVPNMPPDKVCICEVTEREIKEIVVWFVKDWAGPIPEPVL